MNKKGEGVITGTVMGIGGLVIGVIVILVITTTLLAAGLFSDAQLSTTYNDETVASVNEQGDYFGNNTYLNAECSIIAVTNGTAAELVAAPNYTQLTTSGCIIAFTGDDIGYNNTDWTVNSTTTYAGDAENSTALMQNSFTEGIDNISAKIPTILLLIAVVFLFGALVLLVAQSRRMGVGGGSSL